MAVLVKNFRACRWSTAARISAGMIEQGKYAACGEYVRSMVKTTTAMNDMLPLHDPAVSAMINSFREMANQKGFEIQVAISNDLRQIPCTVYEINTIIGTSSNSVKTTP